jgi:hypothetical protein
MNRKTQAQIKEAARCYLVDALNAAFRAGPPRDLLMVAEDLAGQLAEREHQHEKECIELLDVLNAYSRREYKLENKLEKAERRHKKLQAKWNIGGPRTVEVAWEYLLDAGMERRQGRTKYCRTSLRNARTYREAAHLNDKGVPR